MWDMMLRSKRSLADTYGGATKRKMNRSRKVIKVHIEGRSIEENVGSGTSLHQASSSSDCISNGAQLSPLPEHSATCQMKISESTEVGKCSSAVMPSSTSSPQVLPNLNHSADLQPSSVSEDCAVGPSSKHSPQMLSNCSQTVDLLPSSVSKDAVRSLELEDSIVEVIPSGTSDVSVLEIKSRDQSSNDNKSADADTSDIIIISDSPGKGSVGSTTLKATSHEVSHLPQGRKRKISDDSGVEILCDISGPRPKKQKKLECAVKDKKLWTKNTIKKKVRTLADTNRNNLQPTNNEQSEDVINLTSKQGSDEKDDVILIDDEVSVINTKEDNKPQDDVIILDSPPAQSSTDNKPKKSVSASVTGLIPHYTQHLIDYISLDGRPPASSSSPSTSTPELPGGSRDRMVTHEHIPVLRRRNPDSRRLNRYQRAALHNRLQIRNSTRSVRSQFVRVPLRNSSPHALAENQISPTRNSTQNATSQNSAVENSRGQNSANENSRGQNSAVENSRGQNSAVENSRGQNSAVENSRGQNSAVENSRGQNSAVENSRGQNSAVENSRAHNFAVQNPRAHNSAVQNSRSHNSAVHNSRSHNSAVHNSRSHNSAVQNSRAHNSAVQNSRAQISSAQNLTAQNSTNQNIVPENSVPDNSIQPTPEVSQSPACAYGSNIYNPNAKDKEESGLRPVILDGNNVAMGHGKGKFFSWRGLHICIKFFLKRGHNVTAFVPTFRRGVCPPELRSEMDEYEKSGQVVFTPSRRIDGRLIVPYDDRFIVQCAAELGGVIVSTDNFRDLLTENDTWKETIEKRLLMFTWVGDLLMFPHDPLGRHGPQLEEFLRFPKK